MNTLTSRKLGMIPIWLASGLAAYFFFNSILMAFIMLMAWIFSSGKSFSFCASFGCRGIVNWPMRARPRKFGD